MNEKLVVGTDICFFVGKKNRPVAFMPSGKVILCRHKISIGYAKVTSVEEKSNYFLVDAEHIAKDVYTGIDYEDFMAVLPMHGFKVGFDRKFINPHWGNEEHQIYAYNMDNYVIIVAETFSWEGKGRTEFNRIQVYCPQLPYRIVHRCRFATIGFSDMTVFNLAVADNQKCDLLSWINGLMKDRLKKWPVNESPSFWTYADDADDELSDEDDNTIVRILEAPLESMEIFKGCKFLEELTG